MFIRRSTIAFAFACAALTLFPTLTLCVVLIMSNPASTAAQETAEPQKEILVPIPADSAALDALDADTSQVLNTLLVEYGDGRSSRLESLLDREDGRFAQLDYLVWDLRGSLSWDPLALRGKLTWDTLSVSFAVGSSVVHSGDRAFTLKSPVTYSERGILYPYPDFVEMLATLDTEGLRLDQDSGTLIRLPPEPRIGSVIQREVGHRYEIMCKLSAKPRPRLDWDRKGTLKVWLKGCWAVPHDLPIPEPGEYAELTAIHPTPTGTLLELEVSRKVEGWSTSWDESDSLWSLTLSSSPREVRQLEMSTFSWDEISLRGRWGLIVVEADLRTAQGRSAQHYLDELAKAIADQLHRRLGVDVEEIRVTGTTTPAERVGAANAAGGALYLSLALGEYGGRIPHGVSAVVPLTRPSDEPLGADAGGSQRDALAREDRGSILVPWQGVADRHAEASRYFARLFSAVRPEGVPVRIEERPLADMVGLDMPVVRLYIGRLGPTWDTEASFPGDSEWDSQDALATSVVQAVQEFTHAGRREKGL